MNKELTLLDNIEEIRQKAAENPEQYSVDYTIRLISAMVAEYVGFHDRSEWTDKLKENADSKYATRLLENSFHI